MISSLAQSEYAASDRRQGRCPKQERDKSRAEVNYNNSDVITVYNERRDERGYEVGGNFPDDLFRGELVGDSPMGVLPTSRFRSPLPSSSEKSCPFRQFGRDQSPSSFATELTFRLHGITPHQLGSQGVLRPEPLG